MKAIACFVIVLMALLSGCVLPSKAPATANDLAAALAAQGVAYTETSSGPLSIGSHARFDENLILQGDALWVELLRIEDDRTYKAVEKVRAILVLSEAVSGQKFPGKPSIYFRKPFVILVRQEPEQGQVLAALNAVLPPAE